MLTPQQQAHLDIITESFTRLTTKKYTAGQREHGGNLWEKRCLIDMAIDEAIDQVTYLITLKEQIQNSGVVLGTTDDIA